MPQVIARKLQKDVLMKRTLMLMAAVVLASSASAAPIQLEVTLSGKTLDVKSAGKTVASYQVSPGVAAHPTPKGKFAIKRLVWNPAWVPPKEGWAKGKTAKGPGDPKNPMKVVKIFFKDPDYYLHGTADEHLLGDPASHGCIRLSSADAYALAKLVMENGGAAKPASWYQEAMSGKRTVTVNLPQPVGITIGP
jgi:lipoprotein-anchoring transpeptidase ErfK/SrfK